MQTQSEKLGLIYDELSSLEQTLLLRDTLSRYFVWQAYNTSAPEYNSMFDLFAPETQARLGQPARVLVQPIFEQVNR